MKKPVRIGIIGDYDSNRLRQVATTAGLEHAARQIGIPLETTWLPTSQIAAKPNELLLEFDAYFGAPGNVVNLEGFLQGVRYARESNKPYLGTCAGFQYAVLEFSRNVMGLESATSAEIDPNSSQLVLSKLSCQIAGKKMQVRIIPGTLAHRLYGKTQALEEYYCHYGINPQFRAVLERAGLKISATDDQDEPRIFELPGKAFYLATLFVPQTSSTPTNPHPLLVGYLKAAI